MNADVKNIKFGTDGWRGIIADDYTFDPRRHRHRRAHHQERES
jgi:hypothetical protein